MKKLLLASLGLAFLSLEACTEIGPSVNLEPENANIDTSYQAPVEAPQQRVVMVEEYTGVRCPNCPAGAAIIKTAINSNPGRVAAVAIHAGVLSQPIDDKSDLDFRTDDATALMNFFGAINVPQPAASIDRIPDNDGDYFNSMKNTWANLISERLAVPARLNIHATSDFDEETKKAAIRVKLAYTQQENKAQKLMIVITESKMIDVQEDAGQYIDNYEHNHVLRDIITPHSGKAILSDVAVKTPGLVYEYGMEYEVNPAWNPENCNIVVFVYNDDNGNYEVAQAAEIHLKD